jgi:sensor histidine kinase YesM
LKSITKNILLRLIGVPFLTFLFYVFDCSDPIYYFYQLLSFFVLSIVLWEGNRWITIILNRYVQWRENVTIRIIIQLGINLVFTIWATYLYSRWLYYTIYNEAYPIETIFKQYLFITVIISLLYNAIYSSEYFFIKWKNTLVEAEELKRQNLLAQYESLKVLINPHFLFNSLNTLIGLINDDKKVAIQYGEYFAKVYRYLLDHRDEKVIPIKEEIGIIEKFIFLFKTRYGSSFKAVINVKKEVMNMFMAPLTLQMLLENAIKHNIISKTKPLVIEIYNENDNYLVVKNNIQKKNLAGKSTEIGLSTIIKRYQFITQKEVVVIENSDDFIVKIPLINQIIET